MASGDWLAGLTDGEGCFALDVRLRKLGKHVHFSFRIGLRADDLAVLLEARKVMGVGKFPAQESPKRGKPKRTLYVNDKEGLEKVIAIFDQHPLRSKKARDYKIWKEAFQYYWSTVPLKYKAMVGVPRQHKRVPDEVFEKMLVYAEQLKIGRVYSEELASQEIPDVLGIRGLRKSGYEAWKKENPTRPCKCGCGQLVEPRRVHYTCRKSLPDFLPGHYFKVQENKKNLFPAWLEANPPKLCACGCGEMIQPTRQHFKSRQVVPDYVHGHNWRGKKRNAKSAA